MIISHRHKFIFIHIPKCAGTSITRALLPYLGEGDVVFGCTPEFEEKSSASLAAGGLFKHSTAREIKSSVDQLIWDEYFKFSFVRDPWDAVLSRYYWWKKNASSWSDEVLQTTIQRSGLKLAGKSIDDLSFPDFVAAIGDLSRYPYRVFLESENAQQLCNFIGRYEQLQADFDRVCRHLKIENATLPISNTSAEMRLVDHYRHEYDAPSKLIVAQTFAKELADFGYAFGQTHIDPPR